MGSFSYTSRVAFICIWEGLCREFLLHIPCCLHFYLGSFSYTSRVAFIFIWEVSLTHPVLPSFLSGEFLPHFPCWLYFSGGGFFCTSEAGFFFSFLLFFNLQNFSYTSRAGFIFYLRSFFYTSRAGFIFMRGVSLTHPILATFSSVEYLLHIPCWLHFYLGNFSYILIGFNLISGPSLTHHVLASSLFGEFLLHLPC